MTTFTEALRAARACIQQDRTHLADSHMGHDNKIDAEGAAGLAEYDAVLQQIDEALSGMTHHITDEQIDAEQQKVSTYPPLPEGWPARFRCDSCEGSGEIGELVSMGYFQPPERQQCTDCNGRGWTGEEPAFNGEHMREYADAHARAVLAVLALAAPQGEPAQDVDLHAAIMNLPCKPENMDAEPNQRLAYKVGHRDARHAAAELVLAMQKDTAPAPAVPSASFDSEQKGTK